ncbi:4582_t:CDS:1, partial [Gigaspora margarita]
ISYSTSSSSNCIGNYHNSISDDYENKIGLESENSDNELKQSQ